MSEHKLSCCLCMRDDTDDNMMRITVRVAKDMSIPKEQSRGVETDQSARTATYNLCGPSCLEIWASVIATVCDPDHPITTAAKKQIEEMSGIPTVNTKKQKGQN